MHFTIPALTSGGPYDSRHFLYYTKMKIIPKNLTPFGLSKLILNGRLKLLEECLSPC